MGMPEVRFFRSSLEETPYRFYCEDGSVRVPRFRIDGDPDLEIAVGGYGREVGGSIMVPLAQWDGRVTIEGKLVDPSAPA
jgi:hypothetical protein